jgi:hypothetical protein
LRNQYAADLICLIDEDSNYCGLGYVMQTVSSSFAAYAFSVVNSSCIASLSFAHEIGHNFGNRHDRASSTAPGAFPYSYGWRRCTTDGTGLRTIMSYACTGAPRINYFSNPDLLYNGFPLGVSYEADPDNAADVVRSMNNTAATVASFRSTPAMPPAAPTNLSATTLAANEIRLTWTDNASNESNYHVQRSLDGSSWSDIVSLGANSTSFNNTGLNGSSTYYYRVRASNTGGASAYSNIAIAATPQAPLSGPTDLRASAASNSQINLSWADTSTTESGFAIERSLSATSGWSEIARVGANTTSYSNAGLTAATTYFYRVRAYNLNENSSYSNPASATTKNAKVNKRR